MKFWKLSLIAFLAGCIENGSPQPTTMETSTSAPQRIEAARREPPQSLTISVGERWRNECLGGAGALSVPVFSRVVNFDAATGRIVLITRDRDGYEGYHEVFVRGDTFSMFGQTARASGDGRTFFLREEVCPNGVRVTRLI